MEFTALPVKVGDSFILQYEDETVLVDGGQNRHHIIDLLEQYFNRGLRFSVLICTHYDSDHINGILGILQARIQFKELWLPEIYGSIALTATKRFSELNRNFENREEFSNLTSPAYEGSASIPYAQTFDESVNLKDLTDILNSPDDLDYWMFNSAHKVLSISEVAHICQTLHQICKLIYNAVQSRSIIRWFKYQDHLTNYQCNRNFFALNAIETGITVYSFQDFLNALYITTTNKESLVFKFEDGDSANVLFSADSNFSFTNSISLNDHSLVTAPHHGSTHNNIAYGKLIGKDLVFVRSGSFNNTRPGSGYLSQSNRYCTICRRRPTFKEVKLAYYSGRFSPINQTKSCLC